MAEKRNVWTHDETVVALGLYFKISFSKCNMFHPEVKRVAKLLGRNPSALAMKIINLARLDPTLQQQGISGLKNGAKLEKDVWQEYEGRLDCLAEDLNRLLKDGTTTSERDEDLKVPVGMDAVRLAKFRVNQSFFRRAVLSAYETTCCVTGISDSRLLIASHIKPWAKCTEGNEKTTPENGLCLNTLHDKAFDRGLITIDTAYKVVLSPSLKSVLTEKVFSEYFGKYDGVVIRLPMHHLPSKIFLEYHNNHVFQQ